MAVELDGNGYTTGSAVTETWDGVTWTHVFVWDAADPWDKPYTFFSLSDPVSWRARFPVTSRLCINGHEYHRRQRRRTKRRR